MGFVLEVVQNDGLSTPFFGAGKTAMNSESTTPECLKLTQSNSRTPAHIYKRNAKLAKKTAREKAVAEGSRHDFQPQLKPSLHHSAAIV